MTQEQSTQVQVAERVECPPTKDILVRTFILTAMLIGFGLYCVYDVWIARNYKPGDDWYWFNVICAVVLTPLGLAPLVYGLRLLRRRFLADREGLGYAGGAKVRWENVRKLVLLGKGRLDVHFEQDARPGVFRLDSWKLENFAPLVALIEVKTADVPTESAEAAN